MQRNKATYSITSGDVDLLKQRMLDWANQCSILCYLDSNSYPSAYDGYECILAVDAVSTIDAATGDGDLLKALQRAHDARPDWFFGHIAYDFKNSLEPKLTSPHDVKTGFPLFSFFVPQTVCFINRDKNLLTIESYDDPATIYLAITRNQDTHSVAVLPQLQFTRTIEQDAYIEAIGKLRKHIADGDCYEINYCTEGYCHDVELAPCAVFKALNKLSPAPFAAYYRLNDAYLMCASPERYMRKSGAMLTAQPIKGTARRDADPTQDAMIKEQLRSDIKERAENVMIVDLMRNDLARCCEVGSVAVDELFGIYSFPQVHQMISTVSGRMCAPAKFTEAIRYSFPMGSMTGAPKYKVMQLIEQYELSGRELFAGTVGYITPTGDFDFNVIIRSLFYNAATRYLAYQTGGAITYDSDPGKEWDEMRLKAWALERVFVRG